ncbi:MAG: hypothetical protein WD066_19960 [Planctomycetaceae bacterium]
MHISGIIFAWLVFPAAIAAAYFSARLIDTRNAWAQRVEAYAEHNEQYARIVAAKESRLRELQGELERVHIGWGQAWSDVNVTVDPATGTLNANNIGTNTRLGGRDPNVADTPTVHVFSPRAEGAWRYIGWFRAEPRENATPLWSLIPGETDDWSSGAWRIRELIPQAGTEQIPAHYNEYARKQVTLAESQQKLADQRGLLAEAESGFKIRQGELLGDPTANPPIEGLINAIRKEQKLRDEAEAEVDRLRREVQSAWRRLVGLAEENVELATGKPGVKPVAAAETGTDSN